MELAQTSNHLRNGKYLAYTKPSVQGHAKVMLLLAPLDRGIRGIARNYLRSVVKNPLNLFKRLYLQSVTIIQPADMLCDGSMSMCDGCPGYHRVERSISLVVQIGGADEIWLLRQGSSEGRSKKSAS